MMTMMLASTQVTAQSTPAYHFLTLNTEEYPPFNHERDGKIAGLATQRLRHAVASAGIDARFVILPWARAYTEARFRPDHCVYSTTRTPAREALFRWAGPLVINEWSVLTLAGRFEDLTRLEELDGLRVGGFLEDAIGDYVEEQGIRVLRAPSERVNMARLKAGLIDVLVSGRATATFLAAEQNVAIDHRFTFARTPLYLACHADVPGEVMERLQTALEAPP
ncbi:transporter substrate-binding domain-containing protein [Halomonas malpeensis]|uniref:Transporter substrate-binding domain-containing protein n=2 Tax=Vreelandella malpeensis TaxID=1172368 RepID=A0ABS8DP80_9GAMM|nr:transporter substrate-binding domain-containing protein [Halomonas malpeensis]